MKYGYLKADDSELNADEDKNGYHAGFTVHRFVSSPSFSGGQTKD